MSGYIYLYSRSPGLRPDAICSVRFDYATLAQLVERVTRNDEVAGSIPAGGSIFRISVSRLILKNNHKDTRN